MSAISGTYRSVKTMMGDGTPRITIDLDCTLAEFSELGPTPGDVFAIAKLSPAAAKATLKPKSLYGEAARALMLSGFFRSPDVWRAVGTDAEFLAWLRRMPCAVCNGEPAEAAHVRRVADGAGTGIKPQYSAIPLCHEHHALQHQKGESAIGGKEWCDRQRIEHVQNWAWAKIKSDLGYESMADVPPAELRQWAVETGVDRFLPEDYR